MFWIIFLILLTIIVFSFLFYAFSFEQNDDSLKLNGPWDDRSGGSAP